MTKQTTIVVTGALRVKSSISDFSTEMYIVVHTENAIATDKALFSSENC